VKQIQNLIPASGQLAAENYLDETGVAALLGVKRRTVRALRASKGLPCLKIANKILRFRRADIEDWILRYRQATPPRSTARSVPAVPPPRSSCKAAAPGNESEAQHG
jgi:excisionase family DNA binding protein